MIHHVRSILVLIFVVLSTSAVAYAELPEEARGRAATALKNEKAGEAVLLDVGALAACTPKPLTPPATINGQLSSASCLDTVINSYEDIYALSGIAGQTVTIDYSSTAYEVFLYMEGVFVETVSFRSTSGVSRRRITYTFPQTRTYKLETEALYSPGESQPHTGPYTLVVTATGTGSTCTTTPTSMCLNNRFAVSGTWSTATASGTAQATALTADSGYLTFFSASNIELIVKVLNACSVNSRFWVYAGGLTDIGVTLTVRDTKTGTERTYTSPAGTPFQPIGDTNALPTCP